MSLKRRIKQLEAERPPSKKEEQLARLFAWRGLFRDMVTLIDEGVIVERQGRDRIHFAPLDTVNDRDGTAWQILHDAQRFIREAAAKTGWRSPSAVSKDWREYRANSLEDLRFWHRQLERWSEEHEQP